MQFYGIFSCIHKSSLVDIRMCSLANKNNKTYTILMSSNTVGT